MTSPTKCQQLPIDSHLAAIQDKIKNHAALVLQASPGSGKTTRVPPALLDAQIVADQKILVLVPRRIAAKAAAQRVAYERGEEVGQTIGYQFRFEKKSSPTTRLLFLTEGLLMRRLLSDPQLSGVGMVVLDEFHERHLHADVALACVRRLQKTTRPDLKILVMSATLDAKRVAQFLGEAPVVTVDAPVFPVTVEYLPQPIKRPLEQEVASAVERIFQSRVRGDTLVFLPGMADIRRCESLLAQRLPEALILPLHGDLSRAEQDLVFEPSAKTKVILATNVAESSITIDGVRCVVDSGLHRQAGYSWWSGLPSLKTRPICKASAVQRTGRAGRTGPGFCLRLYSKSDFDARPEFEIPEVKRVDLAQTVLEIMNLEVGPLNDFSWFEVPEEAALMSSCELLRQLEAIKRDGLQDVLTSVGRKMARLPLAPRFARLMLAAQERGVLREAALLVAHLSEGDLCQMDALSVLEQSETPAVKRVADQVMSLLDAESRSQEVADVGLELAQSVLHAFADRVAQRRESRSAKVTHGLKQELVFCGGGSALVEQTPLTQAHEYFVVLDVEERAVNRNQSAQMMVKTLCAIEPEWLFDVQNNILSESSELIFDDRLSKAYHVSRLTYGKLVLSESRIECDDPSVGVQMALRDLGLDSDKIKALAVTDVFEVLRKRGNPDAFEALLARLALLQRHFPGSGLTNFVQDGISVVWDRLVAQLVEIDDLFDADACQRILAQLAPPEIALRLHEWLPLALRLPSGRKSPVIYRWNQDPYVASRLQDFFGLSKTPALLGGKLPLTVHLLAPNMRAVQVTRDLASFWKTVYPELRPQLSRRYPRHSWPENP